MKQCNECSEYKELDEFYNHKSSSDGKYPSCKSCIKENMRIYYLLNKEKIKLTTKNYKKRLPWMTAYYGARRRCKNPSQKDFKNYKGKGIKFKITKEEVKKLWFECKADLMKYPSINRKDNDGNYTYDNCEFIELGKNSAEMNSRTKIKPVLQYTMEGKFIKEWSSITLASKELNIKISNISAVCLEKYGFKTAGGYIWRFK